MLTMRDIAGKQLSRNVGYVHAAAVFTLMVLTAFSIPSVQAQTFNFALLHGFTNVPDGGNPGPLIRDAQGNLYGTTEWGGTICGGDAYTCGTVFRIDAAGNETVLYRFHGQGDGANPVAALVRDAAGNLYGTTTGNGAIPADSTIFKLDAKGNETVLHTADGQDDCCLDSALALDEAGNLYGTSLYAGEQGCGPDQLGCGTVFELKTNGKFTVLHRFSGTDGIRPEGGLVRGAKGTLFGTTVMGGDLKCTPPSGCGTVFKLDSNGQETVLHSFSGRADGAMPGGLFQDLHGNLYGITLRGGNANCNASSGCGTVFEMGRNGKFAVLYTFTSADIHTPYYTTLVMDSKRNLYAADRADGILFEISSHGSFKKIFTFPPGKSPDGSNATGLVLASDGTFYGSMIAGGPTDCGPPNSKQGCGTVFKLSR
jgi:uncharacterized repeat protein (TIGR03803 family)